MRWVFICGWEVGVICNLTAYEYIWSQVMCETFLLFNGAQVGCCAWDPDSRSTAPLTVVRLMMFSMLSVVQVQSKDKKVVSLKGTHSTVIFPFLALLSPLLESQMTHGPKK